MAQLDTGRNTRWAWVCGKAGRCAAGVSNFALGVSVTAVAHAGSKFKAAPKPPEATAAAADSEPTMILGYDANTLFFVAAGAIAIFWFTVGGGRKPKLSKD